MSFADGLDSISDLSELTAIETDPSDTQSLFTPTTGARQSSLLHPPTRGRHIRKRTHTQA
jgi:hypothetical protein